MTSAAVDDRALPRLAPDEAARILALALVALLCLAPGLLRIAAGSASPPPSGGCPGGASRIDGRVVCGRSGAALDPVAELWLGRRLDLNRVDAAALAVAPGIGEGLARRIVEHREARGPFRRLEELEDVPGIGPRLRARLEPFVAIHP
jgi:DNA uptake protein ComE-like DNA-binding protein